MFRCSKFFLFIINLGILSFSQVKFSLHPIQVLKHLSLPQHLPTTLTNNTTMLLHILIGKESKFFEYFIGIILKTEFQQIYPAHYQPKNAWVDCVTSDKGLVQQGISTVNGSLLFKF